ncbi:hypothetical protein, partial [Nocardioides sp.]|uniref:hypothetical protein n=1 Tax=Nocardioides sp. TaxID=35761 RepID=UPI001A2CC3E6
MTALLLALTGVLTLLVVAVALLAVRLTRRVGQLEARLAVSSDPNWSPSAPQDDQNRSLDAPVAA